jgi:hypothetical protein
MTTIAQLPAAASVGANDLLPLSQAGLLYSAKICQITANLQPLLNVPTGGLLGRQSTGTGAPEPLSVGTGLVLSGSMLSANGDDHALYPLQTVMALTDELVISNNGTAGLLPVTALRGLFSPGSGVSIDSAGVITIAATGAAGPAGPPGPAGPTGAAGPQGLTGPMGQGLTAPAAANSASSIGGSDYVAIWQNGATMWMPYGQLIGGQTINQLPAAAPAADSDLLLVAQGSSSLSVQSFGSVWAYLQAKLTTVKTGVVELTANTVLDGTAHNNRILIASAPLNLTANFANMGSGFTCTLINLSPGIVNFGTGISSGSGGTTLPPGGSAALIGFSYSGGSQVWWSGIVPNAATITVASITAPAPGTAFAVSGGIFNDAPLALDYSTDGGITWNAAASPVITANAYSFIAAGLNAGTYTIRVRDHGNLAIAGVSNSFTITPPSVSINALPAASIVNVALTVSGTVLPGNNGVRAGLSANATTAPSAWANATVTNGSWTASLTPGAAGTYYVWAQQSAATTVQAISSAISIVAATLTLSVPSTATAGSAMTVSGTVSPIADTVNLQLSTQNTAAPTSGWSASTNSNGNFSISLTPNAAGTFYAWAQDPVSGVTAVSSAITVAAAPAVTYTINNPGGTYTHGLGIIPINGNVTPPQSIATQVALSTSNSIAPTSGWQAASNINANTLWAIYYTMPDTAGNYYVWVETTSGAAQIVSSFTIPVS